MKLRRYFKRYKLIAILGAFCKFLEAMSQLVLPIIMADLIDKGMKHSNYNLIWNHSLIIGVLVIFGFLIAILGQYCASIVSQGVGSNIRKGLFEKINSFSFQELDSFSASTLTNRITNDVNQIQNTILLVIRLALRSPFIIVGSVIGMIIINIQIALVLIIALPIFATAIILIMYFSMKTYQKTQIKIDKMSKIVSENIHGSRMIRAISNTDYEKKRYEKENDTMAKLMSKLGKLTSLSNPITTLLLNIALLIMIYLSAIEVKEGNLSSGQIAIIINYSTEMVLALIVFMNLILTFTRGLSARKRVKEVLNSKVGINNSTDIKSFNKNFNTIEFKNVSFNYNENINPSLSNINLSIKKGETIGITGLTGSGKSSIINLIPRFYDVTNGEILINNINIKDYDIKELRDNVAYVSQTSYMLSGSLKKNIEMGKLISDIELDILAKKSKSYDFIKDKKDGINESVANNGANFSGGQKQRLSITRALAKESPILILDDSFSALDYLTDSFIRKELKKLKDLTVIIVSQRISSLMNADKIVVMKDGYIDYIGKHEELVKNCSLYKEIYETQQNMEVKEQ